MFKYSRISIIVSSFVLINGAFTSNANAQVENQVYSYDQSQKYNDLLYSTKTRFHTSSRPFLFKHELLDRKDSLETSNPASSQNWIMRKLFNEHLVDVTKDDHTFYLDFLPDFQIGSE